MGETNFQIPPVTNITPGIGDSLLKKGVRGLADHYAEAGENKTTDEFVVRVRKNQDFVAFRLNTKRLVERREIERTNELKRRTGR